MNNVSFYCIEGRERSGVVEATRRTIASARTLARHWRRSGVNDIVIRHPDGRSQSLGDMPVVVVNRRNGKLPAMFSEMGAYRFHYFDSTQQETMCFVHANCDSDAVAFAKTKQLGLKLEVREAARLVARLGAAGFPTPSMSRRDQSIPFGETRILP